MFEDLKDQNLNISYSPGKNGLPYKKILLATLGLFIVILLIIFFILIKNKPQKSLVDVIEPEPLLTGSSTVSSTSTLPLNDLNSSSDENLSDDDFDTAKAEDFTFANYYENPNESFFSHPNNYKLPILTKADLSNYYEFSRKIDITDGQLNEINKNGFSIINNSIAKDENNFFGAYSKLVDANIPQLLTTDFLVYYYQNRMKEVYDEVRSNIFYRDLWKINKQLFDIASNRYKNNKTHSGDVNNPVLEGQRLEAAYFATSLELLKPNEEQVKKQTLNDENKFTQNEIIDYDFNLPEFLAEDVSKELKLIHQAETKEKSPVFRYERDYTAFRVPKEYQNSSKLTNYYLATKWVNSVFPLYYRNDSCPGCLLDKYDWLNNFIANNYVAKDFNDNQDIKNRWARVYKVMSYFEGLRKDLTYLDYQTALANLYGNDYKMENIFSSVQGMDKIMGEAGRIQKEIERQSTFKQIEGGIDRSNKNNRQYVGMRLLQETYWPDYYILSQLTTPKVTTYTKNINDLKNNKINITGCQTSNKSTYERCGAIGLDIINLLYPVTKNSYFNENSSYKDYTNQSRNLKNQLNNFKLADWHSSNYWSTLDISRKAVLNQEASYGPIYTATDGWKNKNVNTALGSWVNLRLSADKLSTSWQETNNFNTDIDSKVFVEPNLNLLNELLANTKMMSQMLSSLRIIKDVDLTSKKLNELTEDLNKIKIATKKELSGQDLDKEDHIALKTIIKKYNVTKISSKSSSIGLGKKQIIESIDGVKLLLAVYQTKDKKILVAGPIFNYTER